MKKDITIAIPTYNNDDDLWRCLYTLTLNTQINARIIVINNDPNTKDIVDTLVSQEGLEHVEVVHKVENVGWMGGINSALDMADTEYFCMLNDDVIFIPEGLDNNLTGGDDVDLSIRFLNKGMKLICDRTVYIHHIGQRTGNRLHEDFWDSEDQQEIIINELIKKHGVNSWFRSFNVGWNKYEPILLGEHSDD